jgi:hypothetical protein
MQQNKKMLSVVCVHVPSVESLMVKVSLANYLRVISLHFRFIYGPVSQEFL